MRGISNKVKRALFVILGTIFLIIGGIGIIIPVLPTTPFLLLAAACYIRGSKRIHHWMINNRIFGEFIRNYMERRGLKTRQKAFTITFLWLTITLSIYYIIEDFLLRILLVLIALAVSVHILMLPTLKQNIN
jgi:uncharacterized membrane protein YbaN (DUF454 family)